MSDSILEIYGHMYDYGSVFTFYGLTFVSILFPPLQTILLAASVCTLSRELGCPNGLGRRRVIENKIRAKEEEMLGKKETTWIDVRISIMIKFSLS
jgi:hypothetical protein